MDPRRLLGALAGIVFVRVLGVTLIITGFLAYAQTLGATPLQAGLAFGAYPLALALLLAPMGHLSDRYGRRAIMTGGLLVAAAGAIVAAAATSWQLLALGRLLCGVGAINGVALALAGETGAPETRTRRYALLGAAAGGGVIVGLLAGALLEPVVGVRGLLVGFAALNVLALLALPAIPRDAPRPRDAAPMPLRPVALLGVAAFCVNLSLTVLLLLLARTLGLTGMPFTWALVAMLLPGGLGMFAAARLADRGRAREVGLAAGALLGAAPVALLLAPSLAVAIVAGVAFFLAHSSLSSLLPSLLSTTAGDARGRAQGIQSTLQYLGSFAGSAAAGALYGATLALASAFVAAGLVAAAAIALVAQSSVPVSSTLAIEK